MFKISYKTFILAPAAILCIVAPFIYKAGFDNTQYFEQSAFLIPMISAAVAILLSFTTFTSRFSGLAMFISSFTSLLAFVKASYLYLSSVFFSGIPETLGEILEQIGFNWSFCAFAYAIAMILGIVTMLLPESAD
jgi:hypothetical protein